MVRLLGSPAVVVQRYGTAPGGRPNEDVLGPLGWRKLRQDMAGGAAFEIVKKLPKAALEYLVPSPPDAGGLAGMRALVAGVVRAGAGLTAGEMGSLLLALGGMGMEPGEVADAITRDPAFLAQHHGDISEALWALDHHHPNHVAVYGYVVPYRAQSTQAGDLAKQELATAGGVVATAAPLTAFLVGYLSQGPEVMDLARQELHQAAGDAGQAGAKMAVLARYNYDAGLRDWAEAEAKRVSESKRSAAKSEAAEVEKAALAALGSAPFLGKKDKHDLVKKRAFPEKKRKYDEDFAGIKATRAGAEAAADAAAPGWHAEVLGGIEGYVAEHTPTIGAGEAGWVIRQTGGDRALADVLTPLFQAFGRPDAESLCTWALEATSQKPERAVRLLLQAAGSSIPAAVAREVAELVLTLPLPDDRLVGIVAGDTTAWDDISAFLSPHGEQGAQALAVLEQALALGMTASELGALGRGSTLEDLAWGLTHAGTGLAGAKKALAKLSIHQEIRSNLDRMLRRAQRPSIVWELLEHDVELAGLWGSISSLDPGQVLTLASEGFNYTVLKAFLVTNRRSIDDLLAASAAAGGARNLLGRIGDFGATLADVVDAYGQRASWNEGTFDDAVMSILYHYCKHVVIEKTRATSIAKYTSDALAVLAGRRGYVRVTGENGGMFRDGKILTFWYKQANEAQLTRIAERRERRPDPRG